jgi:FkbM family methyltransferase
VTVLAQARSSRNKYLNSCSTDACTYIRLVYTLPTLQLDFILAHFPFSLSFPPISHLSSTMRRRNASPRPVVVLGGLAALVAIIILALRGLSGSSSPSTPSASTFRGVPAPSTSHLPAPPSHPPAVPGAVKLPAPGSFSTSTVTFVDGSSLHVSTTNSYFAKWWRDSFPSWHHEVFAAFSAYLSTGRFTTYLGFGEWIGPTVMFASKFVDKAIALEPDPICRAALAENIAANPEVRERTTVSQVCIAPEAGTLKLRGAGASGSYLDGVVDNSGAREYKEAHPDMVVNVTCVTLPYFMAASGLDPSSTFVKMDTEGAEWAILPALVPWISAMPEGSKPTMIISFHANDAAAENVEGVLRFLHLFRFGGPWNTVSDGVLPFRTPAANITRDDLPVGHYFDIIVSDV